jgi:hypothetical protein
MVKQKHSSSTYHSGYIRIKRQLTIPKTTDLFPVLVAMLVILFIGLPTMLLGMGNQDVEWFMLSSAIFITALSILQIILFFLKFRYLQRHKFKNNEQVTGFSPASSEEESNKASKGDVIWSEKPQLGM